VSFADTYAQQLERMLNAALTGPRVEVVNAGVDGYTSAQGSVLLRTKLLQYEPDLLTVCYGFNDRTGHAKLNDRQRMAQQIPTVVALRRTFNRSMLYLALKKLLFRAMLACGGSDPFARGKTLVSRVPVPHYVENLAQIVSDARSRRIAVVLLSIDNRERPYRAFTEHVAQKAGVPFLSLQMEKHADLYVHHADCHPNASGHRHIAKELARLLVAQGTLASR